MDLSFVGSLGFRFADRYSLFRKSSILSPASLPCIWSSAHGAGSRNLARSCPAFGGMEPPGQRFVKA